MRGPTQAVGLAGAEAVHVSVPQPEISVVILCYKAEEAVRTFIAQMKQALERQGLRHELVLVANYHEGKVPPDRTPTIVAELARHDPTLKIVTKPKQGMMGWDMRSGLALATGETIAVVDGDGQISADDVLTVYETLRRGRYDLVQTYRVKRFDGLGRFLLSRVYNLVVRLLFPAVKVRDANSKPKILTRRALQRLALQSNGWFIDAEIVLRASYLGFRIAEIPTVFYLNEHRRSFVRPHAILEFARELIRFRFKDLRRDDHG